MNPKVVKSINVQNSQSFMISIKIVILSMFKKKNVSTKRFQKY